MSDQELEILEEAFTLKINRFYWSEKNGQENFEINGIIFEPFEQRVIEKMFILSAAFPENSAIKLDLMPENFMSKLLKSKLAMRQENSQVYLTKEFWNHRECWSDWNTKYLDKALKLSKS